MSADDLPKGMSEEEKLRYYWELTPSLRAVLPFGSNRGVFTVHDDGPYNGWSLALSRATGGEAVFKIVQDHQESAVWVVTMQWVQGATHFIQYDGLRSGGADPFAYLRGGYLINSGRLLIGHPTVPPAQFAHHSWIIVRFGVKGLFLVPKDSGYYNPPTFEPGYFKLGSGSPPRVDWRTLRPEDTPLGLEFDPVGDVLNKPG